MSSSVGIDPTHAYRREARRLRGRLNGRPHELYGSLRQLSDRYDSLYAAEAPEPQTPASGFADLVARQLREGILLYSARLDLLETAGRLGIGRFEANLIIAAVQHRSGCGNVRIPPGKRRPSGRLASLLIFLLVQSSIVLLAWCAFAR